MFHDADSELRGDVVARDEAVEAIGEGHANAVRHRRRGSSGGSRGGSTYDEPL